MFRGKASWALCVGVQILTAFSTWSFDLSVRTLMANISLIKLEQQNQGDRRNPSSICEHLGSIDHVVPLNLS